MAQWISILPRTQVLFLIQEDPTCCRATKPVCHTSEAALEAWEPPLLSPCAVTTETPLPYSPGSETREARAMRSLRTARKGRPHLLQLKKSLSSARKTQGSQKQTENCFKKKF